MTDLALSQAAKDLIDQLQADNGDILFLISGGCCDGSAPLCFTADDFKLGQSDQLLGHAGGVPVYVSSALNEYLNTEDGFYLDIESGRGGGFSIEAPYGVRFINRAACPV